MYSCYGMLARSEQTACAHQNVWARFVKGTPKTSTLSERAWAKQLLRICFDSELSKQQTRCCPSVHTPLQKLSLVEIPKISSLARLLYLLCSSLRRNIRRNGLLFFPLFWRGVWLWVCACTLEMWGGFLLIWLMWMQAAAWLCVNECKIQLACWCRCNQPWLCALFSCKAMLNRAASKEREKAKKDKICRRCVCVCVCVWVCVCVSVCVCDKSPRIIPYI